MEPLTRNGGFIGATLDFGAEDYYTTTGGVSSPVLVGETSSGAAASSSIPVPAGTAVNDIAILFGGADYNARGIGTELCASWTQVESAQFSSTTGHAWNLFYGTVTTLDPYVTVAATVYASGWSLLVFRNATVGNVLNENFLTEAGVANPPAINVSSGSTVVTVCCYDDRSGTISPPTGYTSINSYNFSQSTSAYLIGSAYKSGLSAGTEDPSAMLASDGSDYCSAATIELIPASSVVQGNKKNSGIWDLPAAYEILSSSGPGAGIEENAIFANLPTNGSTTVSMSGLSFKAGDNLFAFLYDENGGDPATFNESGWTQLQYTNSGGTGTGMLYHKIADGTETSVSVSYFGQFDFLGIIFYSVSGSYTYQSSAQLFQTSGNPNPPSVGTFVAGDISLVFGAYGDDIAVITPSAGYTKLAGGTSGVTARGCSMAMGTANTITGIYDPGPFSGAGDENYAVHVRLSKP